MTENLFLNWNLDLHTLKQICKDNRIKIECEISKESLNILLDAQYEQIKILNLSKFTLNTIPKSITLLPNIQTLIIPRKHEIALPNNFFEILGINRLNNIHISRSNQNMVTFDAKNNIQKLINSKQAEEFYTKNRINTLVKNII